MKLQEPLLQVEAQGLVETRQVHSILVERLKQVEQQYLIQLQHSIQLELQPMQQVKVQLQQFKQLEIQIQLGRQLLLQLQRLRQVHKYLKELPHQQLEQSSTQKFLAQKHLMRPSGMVASGRKINKYQRRNNEIRRKRYHS